MSKDESSEEKDTASKAIAPDSPPDDGDAETQAREIDADSQAEAQPLEIEIDEDTGAQADVDAADQAAPAAPLTPNKPRRSWLSGFNFLLIVALAGAAGYYWWLEQQVKQDYRAKITELRTALDEKAASARVDSRFGSLQSDLGELGQKVTKLDVAQESLKSASEKLYELYGRDKNDWQLAEVEYLMRVAQHKLVLQDDFAGAAITLQAASDKIALTGDPGLLPVRIKISDEIADLKTRKRADLVGMTLVLAQLGRQLRALQPGFEPRVDTTAAASDAEPQDWLGRIDNFIDSLVEVRFESAEPSEIEAHAANVDETLADNLKLARWAVLERDAAQYATLIEQSLRLFREFYDLDDAANNDFFRQLQELQKMQLRPEIPDISGSLRELQRILSQRETEPADG